MQVPVRDDSWQDDYDFSAQCREGAKVADGAAGKFQCREYCRTLDLSI